MRQNRHLKGSLAPRIRSRLVAVLAPRKQWVHFD